MPVPDLEGLLRALVEARVGPVLVASRTDLVAVTRAGGRPIDLADLERLGER